MSWQRLKTDFRFALITLFGALASLFLLPIAAYRFATGATLTGFIDLAVVLFIGGCVRYVWRGGSPERAGVVAAVTCNLGTVIVAHLVGLAGLLWIYPALVANYLLVPPRLAVAISAMTVGATAIFGTGLDGAFDRIAFVATTTVVSLFAFIFAQRTESQHRQLERLATRDPLTSASNRRAMEKELPVAIEAARRTRTPLGIAVLDIDHFKRINDGHGHEAGDRVLIDFVRLVGEATRRGDRLFRYGGEEFVLLLPGADARDLAGLAEKLRRRVAGGLSIGTQPVTVSIGAAELAPGEQASEWLARADAAMYRAKHRGRNRVEVDESPAPVEPPGYPGRGCER
jgi:diguanylate cyclase (GGDEF)-like protein